MSNFLFLVGTTNNSELGGPRTSWIDKILLPNLCIVSFITFLAHYQGKFGFGKFQQKLELRSDPPPPCWAKCPSFSENYFWWHPLGKTSNTTLRILPKSAKSTHFAAKLRKHSHLEKTIKDKNLTMFINYPPPKQENCTCTKRSGPWFFFFQCCMMTKKFWQFDQLTVVRRQKTACATDSTYLK